MKVVIVGGGFAGVKTALELMNKDGFSVTLISQGADFEYHGALYRSATGNSPLEVVIRLSEIFEKARNITLVIDRVSALNNKVKVVRGETGQTYNYDILVLAMGNEKNYFGIEGLEKFAHSMYTISDTLRLRHDLIHLFTIEHKNSVRIAVVGAGPSGVELASELDRFAQDVAAKYMLKPKKVNVELIDGSNRVLPSLSEEASQKALRRLKNIGVSVTLNAQVVRCRMNSLTLNTGECAADLIVWTAGSSIGSFYTKYPELFHIEKGKVVVDEFLRLPKDDSIFVLGDNAKTPYSGMAQTAIYDALFVAKNLQNGMRGKEWKTYKPKEPVYVVPICGKWAIVQYGKKVRSGRYGWSVRRKADLFIYANFEPLKKAKKLWRSGYHVAHY